MKCEIIKIKSLEDLNDKNLLENIRNILDNEDVVCIKNVLSNSQCSNLIQQALQHETIGRKRNWDSVGIPMWNNLKVNEMPEYSPPSCSGKYFSISFDRDDIFPDLQFYKRFYLSLSNIKTDFHTSPDYDFHLRLTFIRYNVGDYFGTHRHGYDNQKYGMILNLSSYNGDNKDLKSGTVIWNSKEEEINTKYIQNVGDLILFNYGCVHRVDKVIEGVRWNVILPNLRK